MELMTVKEEELDTSEIDALEITLKEEELNISDIDESEIFSALPSLTQNNTIVRTLAEPMMSHSQERDFKCTICETTFNEKQFLHNHRHMDKQLIGRPLHICEFCSKRFQRRSELVSHMVTHSQDRNFECAICGTTFKRKQVLSVHLKTRHADKFQMEYGHICKVCRKGFLSRSKLAQHMVSHSQERNFECNICVATFKRKIHLNDHLKTLHAARFQMESGHICELCSKRCLSRSKLAEHMVSHSQERHFECTICGTHYKRKHSLNNHLKRRHADVK